MIHTVTFNPALDYIVRLEDLKLGEVNRVNYEQILPGGKGVNVSIVLGNLGHANRALGFSAGFTGIALEGMLEEFGVTCDFVKVAKGMTRINLKAKAKEETEVNGIGSPAPSPRRFPMTCTSASWPAWRAAASTSWSMPRATCS